MNKNINSLDILIKKEASLSAINLGVGLTFLRKYDFGHPAFLYQAWFSLAIGIERLIKIILYFDYLIQNPKNGKKGIPKLFFKNKGHNIKDMFKECEKIATFYNEKAGLQKIIKNDISLAIMNHISEFAQSDRYFYLNQIEKLNSQKKDPLENWGIEIENKIFKKNKAKIHLKYDKYSQEMNSEIFPYKRNDFDLKRMQISFFQNESVRNCLPIIKYLVNILDKQIKVLPNFSFTEEFFIIFKHGSASRKSWNPYGRNHLTF